jgi:predicted RNA binding protein YcfA (HicA-like mRNA interferase family)
MPDLGRILDLLNRDEALQLGEPDEPERDMWPTVEPNEEVYEVDHARLFPTERPLDRGHQDFEFFGDEWDLPDAAAEIVLNPNSESTKEQGVQDGPQAVSDRPPEWDVWAWYQPIHFFGPDWGIFIREAGLVECARRISRLLPASLRTSGRASMLAKALIRASFGALFLHEQYHHKTESLALRLHVVERRPVYPEYRLRVYPKSTGTNAQIEEGLANADSWFRVGRAPYSRWTGPTVTRCTKDYLEASFQHAPGGYGRAAGLLTPFDFEPAQHDLFVQVQDGRYPRRSQPSEFGIASHINRSLFAVTQRIWTIVPAGTRSVLPTHRPIAPLTTRRLETFIRQAGWREVPGAGKGSHRKFRDGVGRMIVLPNRKDVSLPVLRSTAETLGLSARELRELAR